MAEELQLLGIIVACQILLCALHVEDVEGLFTAYILKFIFERGPVN